MWTHVGPDDDREAAPVPFSPPENELPVALPANLVLAAPVTPPWR